MRRLFHISGWLLLRLCWPLFSKFHTWKKPRKEVSYKCYSLTEWDTFIHSKMPFHEKIMQCCLVDVCLPLIAGWLVLALLLS
jgi:hypothetical protein